MSGYYSKNKHHFWSQILAGIIAIFLLPNTQSFEDRPSFASNYQNQQIQPSPVLRSLVKKLDRVLQTKTQLSTIKSEIGKVFQIDPIFIPQQINPSALIRGSPVLLS